MRAEQSMPPVDALRTLADEIAAGMVAESLRRLVGRPVTYTVEPIEVPPTSARRALPPSRPQLRQLVARRKAKGLPSVPPGACYRCDHPQTEHVGENGACLHRGGCSCKEFYK